MNGNKSRTIGRKRNKRRVKTLAMCGDKKQPGAEKTPTETPTDGTKFRAEIAKPRLKTGRCFGQSAGVENTEAAFCKTPNAKVEK